MPVLQELTSAIERLDLHAPVTWLQKEVQWSDARMSAAITHTKQYARDCERVFGRVIHHTPRSSSDAPDAVSDCCEE